MMAGTGSTDAELLQGDANDFAAFYERHEQGLLAYFVRRVGEPDRAVDLTAESFARALEGRRRFDPALGDARGWLFGIARHVLAASLERGRIEDDARRRLEMEPIVLDDDCLRHVETLGSQPVLEALESLPADQQVAVRGRVLAEHDYAELASALNCSESVVRQRVSRGLKALRHVVEGQS